MLVYLVRCHLPRERGRVYGTGLLNSLWAGTSKKLSSIFSLDSCYVSFRFVFSSLGPKGSPRSERWTSHFPKQVPCNTEFTFPSSKGSAQSSSTGGWCGKRMETESEVWSLICLERALLTRGSAYLERKRQNHPGNDKQEGPQVSVSQWQTEKEGEYDELFIQVNAFNIKGCPLF